MTKPDPDRYRNLWTEEERRRLAPILARFSAGIAGLAGAVDQKADALSRFQQACRDARAAWAERNTPPRVPRDATTVAAWKAQIYAPKVRLGHHATHGRALFAAAPIDEAEVVIVEPHLLVADMPSESVGDEEETALGLLTRRWALVRQLEGRGAAALALVRDLYNAHEEAIPRFAAQVHAARAAGLRGLRELTDREVAELLGIVVCNAFTRSRGSDDRETCLQPVMAMLAHSCEPNTIRFFGDAAAFVQARQPIAEGEELTCAYVPQKTPVGERLVYLAYVYGFICDCPRCRSATLADLEADLRRVRLPTPWDGVGSSSEGVAARRAAVHAVVEAISTRNRAGHAG